MPLNKDIPEAILKQVKLVVFDSDGVTIPRGTQIAEHVEHGPVEKLEINMKTFVITDDFAALLDQLRTKLTVAISSGRALLYLQTMFAPIVGKNTILQAENGNISLIDGSVVQHFDYDETYFETLAEIRADVEQLAIKGIEPKQFILSIHSDQEFPEVYDIVKKHDRRHELKVMWNGEAFDVMRREVSKAAGLQKLLDHLGLKREQMIAIGDRVNDQEMIELAGVGISADNEKLPADYWTVGDSLPGELLARYLIQNL